MMVDTLRKEELLNSLDQKCKLCKACPLHEGRTQSVFGEGNSDAILMFVGEGPGADEDRLGRPFVGKAGQLFDRILASVGIKRQEVYITNVVKCRPPNNRVPTTEEMEACRPFLDAQIAIVNPHIIVTLGSTSTRALLPSATSITKVRGKWFDWRGGIRVFPMFHPSFLLRNPTFAPGSPKSLTWEDIKEVSRVYKELKDNLERG